MQDAVDAIGGLDVSVTTVGDGIAMRALLKTGPHDLDAFRQVIDLNLSATFNIDRLGAWHMIGNEREHGKHAVIVNTASVAAYEG